MKGTLKCTNEWLVSQDGQDGRLFPIHPEQQDEMHVFDIHQEYSIEYSLCYIVEIKLYCVKIAKSSFPKPHIPKTLLDKINNIEIVDGEESFYIGSDLIVELAYVENTLKVFVSKKQ